jgi:hypothetical protein
MSNSISSFIKAYGSKIVKEVFVNPEINYRTEAQVDHKQLTTYYSQGFLTDHQYQQLLSYSEHDLLELIFSYHSWLRSSPESVYVGLNQI